MKEAEMNRNKCGKTKDEGFGRDMFLGRFTPIQWNWK